MSDKKYLVSLNSSGRKRQPRKKFTPKPYTPKIAKQGTPRFTPPVDPPTHKEFHVQKPTEILKPKVVAKKNPRARKRKIISTRRTPVNPEK